MKNRSLLAKKLRLFCKNIKRKRTEKMHLQTDLELKKKEIKKLNDKFNVDMFHTKIRGGKAFAAEQKIREFKIFLLKYLGVQGNKKEKDKFMKMNQMGFQITNLNVQVKKSKKKMIFKLNQKENHKKYLKQQNIIKRELQNQ